MAEGLAKNSYNSLRGIKDWRTDDANGEQNDLPSLSKGKLKDFFYIRNLYGNIEDVFNRPVYSSPEDWIDVAIREPESTRGFFSKLVTTPQSRRCLNLGSYNYLGLQGSTLPWHKVLLLPMALHASYDFSIFVGNSLSLADFRGVTYWWYMLSLVLSLSITGLAAWLARKCAVQLWARWALELGDAADEGHNVHALIESGAIARPCSACRCCQGVVGPVDCACCDCCY